MLSVLTPKEIEIPLSPIQIVKIDEGDVVDSISKALEKVKYPRVLLLLTEEPPSVQLIRGMLRAIRRTHAVVPIEDGKARLELILFNSTFLRVVVKLLREVEWNRLDGLIRGLGKVIYMTEDELLAGAKKGMLVKPGKMPERLHNLIGHIFWVGAYSEHVYKRGGGQKLLLRGARAFESEGKLYETKGVLNIASIAYEDAARLYELAGAKEKAEALRSKSSSLVS